MKADSSPETIILDWSGFCPLIYRGGYYDEARLMSAALFSYLGGVSPS